MENEKKQSEDQPISKSDDLRTKVMDKIERGEVKPRSKESIKTEHLFFGLALLIYLLGAGFIINMLIFWGNAGGHLHELRFGPPGITHFARSFPAEWFVGAILLFTLAYLTLKHFDISYKKPLGFILGGLAIVALLVGIALSVTPINRGLVGKTRMGQFPPMRNIYRPGMHRLARDSAVGTIKKIEDGIITLTITGKDIDIKTTDKTKYPPGYTPAVGDSVRVIGSKINDSYEALGIIKVDNDFDNLPMRPKMLNFRRPPIREMM